VGVHSALHFTLLHRSDQLHMLTIGQPDLKTFKGSSCLGTIRGLTAKEIPVIGLIVYTDRHFLEKSSREAQILVCKKSLHPFGVALLYVTSMLSKQETLLCRPPDTHAS